MRKFWLDPDFLLFDHRKKLKVLTPLGWCALLGISAVVMGAAIAFAT